jgi:hypothetical protein
MKTPALGTYIVTTFFLIIPPILLGALFGAATLTTLLCVLVALEAISSDLLFQLTLLSVFSMQLL